MTTTQLRERAAELQEQMSGELTLTKLDFILIGLICLMAGICIGLLTAPLTHGVSIGSHNASNNTGNGCSNGNNDNSNHA